MSRQAIVTGAAGGIGRAVAQALVDAGARVLAVDLEPDPAGPGEPFAADLTTRDGNRAAVDAAVAAFGGIDTIVANAGFQHVAPVAEFDEDRWDALLALERARPLHRLIEPEEVAAAVLFLLGPRGDTFTGAPFIMDAGWTAR